jgi:hypothetical protein
VARPVGAVNQLVVKPRAFLRNARCLEQQLAALVAEFGVVREQADPHARHSGAATIPAAMRSDYEVPIGGVGS